ncbi:MAG: MFS transporter [Chlamydiales bacterium]|nr:MFS transporter [Chlamydiales bacterium]
MSSRTTFLSWTIWIVASIFYAYQYILRVMPNIMLNDIMSQFHIDAATFGQFAGIYYIGYSAMHLPIGILLDRHGPRTIMSACILLTVLGLTPLLFSDHWIWLLLGRGLIGIGSSAAILGIFKVIRMTFKESKFPRMLSLSVTIGLLGAIYGGEPVNYLQSRFGYETVIYSFAATGIILALATYLLIPHEKTPSQTTIRGDIKEVLCHRKVLYTCLFAGFMIGPLEGFADVWGTSFLEQVYGLQQPLSASLPSLIFVGMCFGAPILNAIAEKIKDYSLTIIGSAVVMAASFFLLLFYHLSSSFLSVSFVLIGISSAYQILAIYQASTYVRPQIAGLATATVNMIMMTFGYAFHTTIGTVVSNLGGPSSSLALWYGVSVIPIALCIGGIGFVFLRFYRKRSI